MTYFQALVLGLVQGLTEFLPISSSGHLIIVPAIFGWSEHSLAFDTTLHLGTAAAVIMYFYKDLVGITKSFLNDIFSKGFQIRSYSEDSNIALKIALGSIPAVVLGLMFDDFIENHTRGIITVVAFSIMGTILLYTAEKHFAKSKNKNDLSFKDALFIGFFQSLALLPGVSRSGATISAGSFVGLNRERAAKFSFLMSVPIVVAAAVFKIIISIKSGDFVFDGVMFVGLLASMLSGISAINLLLHYLKSNNLYIFIMYRVLLVVLLIGLIL